MHALCKISLDYFTAKEDFSALHNKLRSKVDIFKQKIHYPLHRQVVDLVI